MVSNRNAGPRGIGFVDGTDNPTGQASIDTVIIDDEDASFAGGSYVIVQKYMHDLKGWNALPVEPQKSIIGRNADTSGQNLTMESGEGFPAKVSHARLAHAHRDIHRRLAG